MQNITSINREIYSPEIQGITQSALSMYRQCPTKARLYLNGFTKNNNSRPLMFGSMFHEYLDIFYTYVKTTSEDTNYKNIIQIINNKYTEYYTDELKKMIENCDSTSPIIMLQCYEKIKVLGSHYIQHYYNDLTTNYEVLKSEESFKINIGSSVPLIGKIDRALVGKKDNSVYLMELKTKSRFNIDTLLMTLKMDLQLKVYLMYLSLEYGEQITNVIYDIVRTPDDKISPDQLDLDISRRPEFHFTRLHINFSKEELENTKNILKHELDNFKKWWRSDPALDTMYSHTCNGNYGVCPNVEFCAGGRKNFTMFETTDKLFKEV